MRLTLLSICILFLSACQLPPTVRAEKTVDSEQVIATEAIAKAEFVNKARVTNRPGYSIYGKPIERTEAQKLPPIFDQRIGIGLGSKGVTVEQFLTAIRLATVSGQSAGLRFSLQQSAVDYIVTLSTTGAGAATQNTYGAVIFVDEENSVRGLLDDSLHRVGLYWDWSANAINVYRTQTRTFKLDRTFGTQSISSSISTNVTASAAGEGGGANNTSSQGVSVESNFPEFLGEFKTTLESFVANNGVVTVVPALSLFTVTTTPDVMARVERLFRSVNTDLNREALVKMEVLQITLSENDSYGVDFLNTVFSGSERFDVSYDSSFTPSGGPQLALSFNSDDLTTDAIVRALSTRATISKRNNYTLPTKNGIATPYQIGSSNPFLSSQNTTIADGGQVVRSSTRGTESDGTMISVLPRFLSTGDVELRISFNSSVLGDLQTFGDSDNFVQGFRKEFENIQQIVSLKPGKTKLLFSTLGDSANLGEGGIGHPKNVLFGGNRDAALDKHYLIMLVTVFPMAVSS